MHFLLLLGFLFISATAFGQASLEVDQAGLGKTREYPFRFEGPEDHFVLRIKNNFTDGTDLKVRMVRASRFTKTAYSLDEPLPLVIQNGSERSLHFNVDYTRWIGPTTQVTLEAFPASATELTLDQIVTIRLQFTAAGKIMVWDPEEKSLLDKINFSQFTEGGEGYSERRIELRRNGSENIFTRLEVEDDPRQTFSYYWNNDHALQDRSTFKLDSRGKTLLVRYSPPDGISRVSDRTRVTLKNVNDPDNSLSFWIVGNLITPEEEGVGTSPAITSVDIPLDANPPPTNTNTGNSGNSGNQGSGTGQQTASSGQQPQPQPTDPQPQPETQPEVDPGPQTPEVNRPEEELAETELDPEEVKKCLDNLRRTAYLKDSTALFYNEEGVRKASLQFDFLPLVAQCQGMRLIPGAATLVLPRVGDDSVSVRNFPLEVDTFIYDTTGTLVFAFPPELMDTIRERGLRDSAYSITFDFEPNLNPQARDTLDMAAFTLSTDVEGRVYRKDWTWYWVGGISLATLLFIFFFGRYRLTRPIPVHDLRYRSKPQRKKRVYAHEVVLDLNRPERDLLALQFKEYEAGAEVAPPPKSAIPPIRGIMKKIFLLGKREETYQFQAEYFSFRVEPILKALHDDMLFRDQDGLFLLGTELTGEILSTDHQDFLITKQKFNYTVYLDPTEIIAYDGPRKTYNIPFIITEEAFEGYKKQKEFVLPLTIVPKERVRA